MTENTINSTNLWVYCSKIESILKYNIYIYIYIIYIILIGLNAYNIFRRDASVLKCGCTQDYLYTL